MNNVIRFDHLKVVPNAHNGTALVDDFCLDVAKGEVVALIGESGAGKSTIGLAALGYSRPGCRPVHGRIYFDGHDVVGLDRQVLQSLRGRRVAYIAQSAAIAFNPSIRIGDQILEAALVHGALDRASAVARAADLARRMSLAEPKLLFQRFPHELSGGQLQRLMTVMALICGPELLILDEPTTAIDVTTQLEVLRAMKTIIAQENVACLYISHDLAVVAQMADRIVVLRHGKLMEVGTAQKIITEPSHPYTQELIAAVKPANFGNLDTCDEAAKQSAPIIELKNIDAHYAGTVQVLKNVNLRIRPGQCIAIIGESGSGKSTLARVLSGLLPASGGEILHHGTRLPPAARNRSGDQLRRIQMVLQHADLALNPRLTIGAALARPLEIFFKLNGKEKRERIAALLTQVGLPADMADRFPSQLSGGQKQRVNLARAIAAEPDILICDEVTSALDTVVSAHVLDLLVSLRRTTRTACIFITHDVSKAGALADEVYVMHRGAVVEAGPTAKVLGTPQHSYTQKLLAAVPELRTDWLKERMNIAS